MKRSCSNSAKSSYTYVDVHPSLKTELVFGNLQLIVSVLLFRITFTPIDCLNNTGCQTLGHSWTCQLYETPRSSDGICARTLLADIFFIILFCLPIKQNYPRNPFFCGGKKKRCRHIFARYFHNNLETLFSRLATCFSFRNGELKKKNTSSARLTNFIFIDMSNPLTLKTFEHFILPTHIFSSYFKIKQTSSRLACLKNQSFLCYVYGSETQKYNVKYEFTCLSSPKRNSFILHILRHNFLQLKLLCM